MKKLICYAMVLCLLFLAACSFSKYPMDDQHVKYGEKALEIADQYLDYELSVDEAYEKISSLNDSRKTLPTVEKDDKNYDGNFFVESEVSLLYFAFSSAKYRKDPSDILESRNRLASTLGKSAR